MVGVVGKAIKGFGKALKSRGRKPGVFDTTQGLRKKPKGNKGGTQRGTEDTPARQEAKLQAKP